MFAAVTPILALLAVVALHVRADPNPNNPGPGDVFIQGKPCTIGWDVDPTGVWKTMKIDLMTGNNYDMVLLTGTSNHSLQWLVFANATRRLYSRWDRRRNQPEQEHFFIHMSTGQWHRSFLTLII